MTAPLDPQAVRRRFPALQGSPPPAYLDGPAGTQTVDAVIAAMSGYLSGPHSNHGGDFASSRSTDESTGAARAAGADLYGAAPSEIVFGQNMTSLTFSVSRALSAAWGPGDEIVLTRLDHDANVTPWRMAAEDRGATVRMVDFDRSTGTLSSDAVAAAIGPSTRLVAVTAASNALGTVTPIADIARTAHANDAIVYVDAVHYAAHRSIDVSALGCDLLVSSAYKYYGPHTGMLWGKAELLESVAPYKVVPAPDTGPDRWETGTQSFESMAGVAAAIDYLASLGEGTTRRQRLIAAFEAIRAHEEGLAARFLSGVAEMAAVTVHGVTDVTRLGERVATFSLEIAGHRPEEVARRMGERGVYVWAGDHYAVGVVDHLGLRDSGGLLRIGFVHYNDDRDVDLALNALDDASG